MQRGVHFDPLRLPLLGGCTTHTQPTGDRALLLVWASGWASVGWSAAAAAAAVVLRYEVVVREREVPHGGVATVVRGLLSFA